MAALAISEELNSLFDRLHQGARLMTPADQQIFASEVTRRKTTSLHIEALETFDDRKREDVEWEAFHCREYRKQVLQDLYSSKLELGDQCVKELLGNRISELPSAVINQLRRASMKGLADFYAKAEIIVKGDLDNPLIWHESESETPETNEVDDPSGLTFKGVFEQFISERTLYCGEKQVNSINAHFEYFMRYLEEEDGITAGKRLLKSVTARITRQYKEHLREAPSNINKKYKGMSLREAVAARGLDGSPALSPTTQKKFLQHLSSLYKFAIEELEYTGINPFLGRADSNLVGQKNQDEKEPFSETQLKEIFNSPLYTGCKSISSCSRPGKLVPTNSYKYWLPLIGLYSGMRLQEILQLRIEDIQQYKGIWVFDLNERGEDQRLKSRQSARRIPIHEDLIELGFLKHVRGLKDGNKERLFHDVKRAKDGTYSSNASKWFSRYLEKIGIKTEKTSFHSFRHNIKDNFRDAGEDGELSEHFCGRTTGSTAERYGSAYSVKRFYEALHKLQFQCTQSLIKENKTCT